MENKSITLPQSVMERWKGSHKIFIETGCLDGRTLQMALDTGFERVLGVEIEDRLYAQCAERFAGNPAVSLYHGDTLVLLPEMLKACGNESALVWLDAHILSAETAPRGEADAPVLREIGYFAPNNPHTLLIDDMRLIGSCGTAWQFLTHDKICAALRAAGYKSLMLEDSNFFSGDILVATK